MAVRINDDTPDERFGGMSRNEFGAMLGDMIAEQYNGGTRMVSWNELEGSSYVVARCESNDYGDVRLGWFPLVSPLLCDREGRVVCDIALPNHAYEFSGDLRGEVEPVRNWVFVDPDFTRCEGELVVDDREASWVFHTCPDKAKVFSDYFKFNEFGDRDVIPASMAETYVFWKTVNRCLENGDILRANREADKAFRALDFGRKYDMVREGVLSGVIPVDHFKKACQEALIPVVHAQARKKKGLGI